MKEKIGNAVLNYEFYKGDDQYSDGDIEDEILKLLQENGDVLNILEHDHRWPVLYHLSPVRQNILEWYDMKADAQVLEIGAGCGAITGVLCRKAKKVICNDLSKRRSIINATRNKEYSNLEIFVGNFNDIILSQKFDYITLIGVLEYARYYTDTTNPFVDFLKKIKGYLKEDGKLLIAIENKYGLKYWAGAREDHTGVAYDGLEGYINTQSKAETFSKKRLDAIIREAGYGNVEFYYPLPDYKFPTQIFSDYNLPKADELSIGRESYDNSRLLSFDENLVYRGLLEENMFDFFANSFFVEVSM